MQGGTCPHSDGLLMDIDHNVPARREINNQTSVDGPMSGDIVAATSYSDKKTMFAGKGKAGRDIGGGFDPDHPYGIFVNHGVPDTAGIVISGIARNNHFALNKCCQLFVFELFGYLLRHGSDCCRDRDLPPAVPTIFRSYRLLVNKLLRL